MLRYTMKRQHSVCLARQRCGRERDRYREFISENDILFLFYGSVQLSCTSRLRIACDKFAIYLLLRALPNMRMKVTPIILPFEAKDFFRARKKESFYFKLSKSRSSTLGIESDAR